MLETLKNAFREFNDNQGPSSVAKLVKDSFLSSAIPENINVFISLKQELPQLVVRLIKRVLTILIAEALPATP
jgi:hypothetical protein